MDLRAFLDLLESLSKTSTLEDIKGVSQAFCEETGLEYYLFAICNPISFSSPETSCISNYPDAWLKIYFEEKMQKHDPVVKYCFDHIAPVRWDYLLEMDEYVSIEGGKVLERAAEMGLVNGVSVPLKVPSGEATIFSMATGSNENLDLRMNGVIPYALSFSVALFENITRLKVYAAQEKQCKLTPRELECLFWACEGKTAWEISKITNITERTIVFHLTSATSKLGAINRQHAIAKAINSGLIKPNLSQWAS